jgi:hypothetical protein
MWPQTPPAHHPDQTVAAAGNNVLGPRANGLAVCFYLMARKICGSAGGLRRHLIGGATSGVIAVPWRRSRNHASVNPT